MAARRSTPRRTTPSSKRSPSRTRRGLQTPTSIFRTACQQVRSRGPRLARRNSSSRIRTNRSFWPRGKGAPSVASRFRFVDRRSSPEQGLVVAVADRRAGGDQRAESDQNQGSPARAAIARLSADRDSGSLAYRLTADAESTLHGPPLSNDPLLPVFLQRTVLGALGPERLKECVVAL